jgi:zinc protease
MRRTASSLLVLMVLNASALAAQQTPPIGRAAALALDFPTLDFDPPEPSLHTLPGGVDVLYLEDRTLPLVNVMAYFEGGYVRFPRESYASGLAMPLLLRSGGTRTLPPDSLELLLELHSVQVSIGSGGGSVSSQVNTLTRELDTALALWGEILKAPRFDARQVEVWRGQELESVRRRKDDPGGLAVTTFNKLMYGDHPIGWQMSAEDLTPEAFSTERLEWMHRRIVCPGNLVLGVTGDVSWEEMEPRLIRLLDGWAPCAEELPPPPIPTIRAAGGVFLIPRELEQSTVVLAHSSQVRQGDTRDYFSSRIGNAVLGASGFSSRLLSRVRTERGYAYSASSLWTTPRLSPGLVGAITQTRSGTTLAATRLILDIVDEMTREEPTEAEVRTTIDEIVNGFVFNFETPTQIVSRQMVYRAEGLPADWLEKYLEGIQSVTPAEVLDVFRREVHPDRMTILVVGNPAAFDAPLETIGPVTILTP